MINQGVTDDTILWTAVTIIPIQRAMNFGWSRDTNKWQIKIGLSLIFCVSKKIDNLNANAYLSWSMLVCVLAGGRESIVVVKGMLYKSWTKAVIPLNHIGFFLPLFPSLPHNLHASPWYLLMLFTDIWFSFTWGTCMTELPDPLILTNELSGMMWQGKTFQSFIYL